MLSGDTSPTTVFDEPYPCEDCPYYDACGRRKMACEAFYIYVTERGRVDKTCREPSIRMYNKTFVRRGKSDRLYERQLRIDALLIEVRGSGDE